MSHNGVKYTGALSIFSQAKGQQLIFTYRCHFYMIFIPSMIVETRFQSLIIAVLQFTPSNPLLIHRTIYVTLFPK